VAEKPKNADADSVSNPAARFTTTHWSVVLEAGQANSAQADDALATLCQHYWYPLYAFLRRLQHPPADAEDLTQGFFGYLIERRLIGRANPQLGRFRTFLLSALQGWLSNQRQRESARKRGGGLRSISFEGLSAEQRYTAEPVTDETPSARYDRAWAEAVIGETWRRLTAEERDAGRFAALRELVLRPADASACREIARQLGTSEGAVKVAAHRLRKRFAELLRATVGETTADPAEVSAEIDYLIRVLGA
jgi:RNA polymerase sigma-70 factor (ECF subfamily)